MTSSRGWTRLVAASARRLFGPRPRLGVDLGGAAVRIVELRRHPDRIDIVASAEPAAARLRADGSIEDIEAVAAQLRELRAAAGLRSAAATTAIPAAACVVRHLNVVARGRRDLDRRVAEAIEELNVDDSREWSIDWSPVRRGSIAPRTEVLLVAVPTDVVRSHVACLREADLLPVAVDVDVVALERLVPFVGVGAERVAALLDIDGSRCVLNVVQNGAAVFHAAVGNGSLLTRPAGAAEAGQAGDVVDAVHDLLGFFWTGEGEEAVAEVFLSGEGARLPGLAERIDARLRVESRVVEPFRSLGKRWLPSDARAAEDGPEWALATALALRGFEA